MKRKIFYSSLLAAAVASPGLVLAQEEVLEEIVITGSLIPSNTQEGRATPVDIVSDIDIQADGSPNIATLMRNQTFQYGVESVTNIIAANGSAGTVAQANIRGLGETSTLTLMDGRRSVTGNVRNLYPQILLQRVETVTDGASALYGTDAVAGINNFIPRKSFDGTEIEGYYGQAGGDGDYNERDVSFITGGAGDDSNWVFATSYRKRTALKFTDRLFYSQGAFSSATEGNPGTFFVPARNATTGAFTGGNGSSALDPGCGLNNQGSGVKNEVGAFSTGVSSLGSCRGEFGANFDYAAPEDVFNSAFIFNKELTDSLSFESEIVYNRQRSTARGSPVNPGGRAFLLPTIAGDHPGNPYRAAVGGQLLYAQDANGDNIPDRQQAVVGGVANPLFDVNNDGLGDVILAASPFDPASGIPFNEDVIINNWRPVYYCLQNGSDACPSNLNEDGTVNGAGTFVVTNQRFVGQLNYEIAGSWSGYTSYLYHRSVADIPVATQSLSAISAGLQGQLLTSNGFEYFNPFSTQYFSCVSTEPGDPGPTLFRNCNGQGVQTDPTQLNSQAVWDAIANYENTRQEDTLQVIDSIATGDVLELPGGTLQAAIGLQWRFTERSEDLGPKHNSGDAYIQALAPDYTTDRNVYALFGELKIPLFESDALGYGELTLAGRSERTDDDSQADLDSDTYKIAGLWEINEMISARASYGTTFISPSLEQLFAPRVNGLSNVTDPITGDAGFKSRLLGGNPLLEPEEADVSNIGFTLNFLDGDLTWDVDYKVFDFENRIIRPLPQDVLNKDAAAYTAAGFTSGNIAQVLAWVNDSRSDPRIIRNPVTGTIVQVNAESVNATAQKWKGFDTRLAYGYDTDFGRFSAVLGGTYVDEYSYQGDPDDPLVNGAGRRNDETGFVPTIPRVRANLRLGWSNDIHTVGFTTRYTHHYIQDDALCGNFVRPDLGPATSAALTASLLAATGTTNECSVGEEIDEYIVFDLQYRADLDGLIGDTNTSITLGALNATDEEGFRDRSLGGTEVSIVDPIGRQVYLRIRQSF